MRSDAAIRNMGVSLEELAKSPAISDMLKRVLGKPHRCVGALRFSDDESAKAFLSVYDLLPHGDRDRVPVEAICIKANVSPATIFGLTLMSAKMVKSQESALLAITSHPKVLKSTIQYAQTPGGDKDRKMLHEAIGFLPTSKGMEMNVNLLGGNVQYAPKSQEPAQANAAEAFGAAFPKLNDSLEKWSDNRRKLLEAGN